MGETQPATVPIGPAVGHTSERATDDASRALVAALSVIVGAVILTFVHYYGGTDGDPEGWFSAVGFATPFFAAGLLALLGVLIHAPWQWWSAGIALVPMSMVSIVLFPLLVPAVALAIFGFRRGSTARDALCGGALAAALIVTFGVLVFHQDPVSWDGGSASDIVTTAEATLAVSVAVGVLAVGWYLGASPQRRTDEQR